MKIINLIAAAALACIVSGCSTTNWQKPEGFHGGDKEFVVLKFKPQNSVGFVKNKAQEEFLENYLINKLAGSKRFNILASGYKGDYSNDAAVVLELTPTVTLSGHPLDRAQTRIAYTVHTVIACNSVDLQSGTYNGVGTLDGKGNSKVPYISQVIAGAQYLHQPDITGLCASSFDRALSDFIRKLNKQFPVTGKVSGMATFGNKTTFQFLRGTIDGVEVSDEILIYAVENKRISPTIAIARAEVALSQSTLTVVKWNTSDPEVSGSLIPRIFRGDKSLKLYAVCRKTVK